MRRSLITLAVLLAVVAAALGLTFVPAAPSRAPSRWCRR